MFDEIVLPFTCSPISSSGIMSSIASLLRVVSGVLRGFSLWRSKSSDFAKGALFPEAWIFVSKESETIEGGGQVTVFAREGQ